MLKTKNNIFKNLETYHKYIVDRFTFTFIWLKSRLKHAWFLYIRNVSYLVFFKKLCSNISYSVFINFADIYKSVSNYKINSQMFEIIFHIQLSVIFWFFSNSGTTCCFHCSSETKIPVILFNESSLVKCQEILSLHKGQGLKYSAFDLPNKMDKSYGCNMECY